MKLAPYQIRKSRSGIFELVRPWMILRPNGIVLAQFETFEEARRAFAGPTEGRQ